VKILQVLTFVGPGNPFGGPTRVAMNQAEELRRRGHEVVVVAAQPSAAARGSWTATDVLGFDSRQILRGAGFAGIVSVPLSRYMWKHVREFDIVHVHMSRDLVTMPAALIARMRGVPYVLQTHGMIEASERKLARVLDAIVTRRIVCRASHVFVLSAGEVAEMHSLMGARTVACDLLPNGLNVGERPPHPQVTDGTPEAMFCSRLHERKRPRAFAQAAIDLLRENVDASFVLIGPDEGELSSLQRLITDAGSPAGLTIEGPLDLDAVGDRLARCALLVLPAVDEPFGMIVVEALAAGKPVIVTESCGLADFVRSSSCGEVVEPDDQIGLTTAMRRMILDPESRREMGIRGLNAVRANFSIEQTVDRVVTAYSTATED
jgi:glycosyltransferase involved in cell wall biosynthesis